MDDSLSMSNNNSSKSYFIKVYQLIHRPLIYPKLANNTMTVSLSKDDNNTQFHQFITVHQ